MTLASTGKLRIAVVVSDYHKVSHTFIRLQVDALIHNGHKVDLIDIGKPRLLDLLTVLPDLMKSLYWLLKGNLPRGFFRQSMRDRGPLGAIIDIHHAFHFRILASGVHDVIYSQFLVNARSLARLRALGMIPSGIVLMCSVRGADVSRYRNLEMLDFGQMAEQIDIFLPVCEFLSGKLIAQNADVCANVVGSPVNIKLMEQVLDGRPTLRFRRGDSLQIISVCRLAEKKGIADAIIACKELLQSDVAFEYVIVGDGEDYNSLRKLVEQLGLDDKVSFLGAQDPRQVFELMARHHLFLAPCKTAVDGDCDGIPNAIKEAMYMGLQIVATKHAGIPELLTEQSDGYLCSSGAPAEIASCIRDFIAADPDRQKAVAINRKIVRDRFSPEATTLKLEASIRAAIECSQP